MQQAFVRLDKPVKGRDLGRQKKGCSMEPGIAKRELTQWAGMGNAVGGFRSWWFVMAKKPLVSRKQG